MLDAEIGLLNAVAPDKLRAGTAQGDPPVFQHVSAVAEPERVICILFDQYDREALLPFDRFDQAANLLHHDGREPGQSSVRGWPCATSQSKLLTV
jgi:hypothetical protein